MPVTPATPATPATPDSPRSDAPLMQQAAYPAAVLMLVAWAVWTFAFDPAPGWVNLLLTLGVFVLVWAVAARGDAGRRS